MKTLDDLIQLKKVLSITQTKDSIIVYLSFGFTMYPLDKWTIDKIYKDLTEENDLIKFISEL